jgi:hypothetical protein
MRRPAAFTEPVVGLNEQLAEGARRVLCCRAIPELSGASQLHERQGKAASQFQR